ncbi:MAG: RNA polymerase sigma factor [Ktedonobacteraceae bacterium]|nr:RNA polymerase sigma factor [Ktedonobacteraceae bacterium]
MFQSLVFPAILQTGQVQVIPGEIHSSKKVPASMSVDKSAEQQGSSLSPDESETALITLYEQFRRPIHSYTYRLLGNQEDADDVTQEVFVRACSSWHGLYEREHLSAWLYRIATNLCVDLLRRKKRISWWPLAQRTRNEDRFEDAGNDDYSAFLADSGGIPEVAERELIRQTLASMPEEYAVALVLSAAQGLPYQEIADIVGVTPNAAATRISRAKKLFAEHYQRLCKDGVVKREKKR